MSANGGSTAATVRPCRCNSRCRRCTTAGPVRRFLLVAADITEAAGGRQALKRSHEQLEVRVRERTAELGRKWLNAAAEQRLKAYLAHHDSLDRVCRNRTLLARRPTKRSRIPLRRT